MGEVGNMEEVGGRGDLGLLCLSVVSISVGYVFPLVGCPREGASVVSILVGCGEVFFLGPSSRKRGPLLGRCRSAAGGCSSLGLIAQATGPLLCRSRASRAGVMLEGEGWVLVWVLVWALMSVWV